MRLRHIGRRLNSTGKTILFSTTFRHADPPGFFCRSRYLRPPGAGSRADYVPAMVNLGIAYMQGGKTADAEQVFRKALSLDSGNRSILLNLGILSERSNQYEQALQWYTRLAELRDVQGMLGLARIAERQGKRADAIKYYQEIAGTNPDPAVQRLINERLSVLGE